MNKGGPGSTPGNFQKNRLEMVQELFWSLFVISFLIF